MRTFLQILSAFLIVIFVSCNDDEPMLAVDITEVSAQSVLQGEEITIQGNGFENVQFVFIETDQVSFQLDGTSLTFQVPITTSPGMKEVTLALPDNVRSTFMLEVLQLPIPVINAISPSAGAPGETITIAGSSLSNATRVNVGDAEANIVSASDSELVFTVPDGLPLNTTATISLESATSDDVESTSIFYVGENLLSNSDLELGTGDDFTNWSKFNGANLLTATTEADESYFGRSLRAVGAGGDPWRTQFASDAANTQIGSEYTLTLWIKAEEGSPGDGGNIRFSTTPNAQYSGNYDITSEWQQIQWVFTANEASTQIVLDLGVIQDAVYFVDNITLIGTGLAGPQPVELILNGGFEEGSGDDFTNWNKFNGSDLLTATTESDQVRNGSRALRAVGAGSDHWRTQFASDVLMTEVGVTYTASIWIKGEAGTPGDGGIIRMSTQGNGDAQYQGDVAVGTDWQEVEWSFTANGTETRIVLDLGFTQDAVYFIDDVSFLAPPEEPAMNVVLNAGFEDGDGDDFTNWSKFNGADLLTATTNSDEVYRGDRALRVVGAGSDHWRTQIATDAFETEVGVDYTASFWIKPEAGSPGVGGIVRMSTTPSPQYQGDQTIGEDWQEVTWTFTANEASTQLVLDLGFTENAVYFLDEVSVTEAN